MKKEKHTFEEGEDYFAIEFDSDDNLIVSMSCWDEVSEYLNNPMVFRTLREALNYSKKEIQGHDTIIFYSFIHPSIELKI